MTLRIERYKHTRHWALYDGAELVVVTVYRRGAQEVQRRLAAQAPAATEAAAQAARARAQPARCSAGTGGLGGTPRTTPPPRRRARRPACVRPGCGSTTPGAPPRHLVSSGVRTGVDCLREMSVV